MLTQQTFSTKGTDMLKIEISINFNLQEHQNVNVGGRMKWKSCIFKSHMRLHK